MHVPINLRFLILGQIMHILWWGGTGWCIRAFVHFVLINVECVGNLKRGSFFFVMRTLMIVSSNFKFRLNGTMFLVITFPYSSTWYLIPSVCL